MTLYSESEYIANALADEFVAQGAYVTTIADRLDRNDEADYVSVLDQDAADDAAAWYYEHGAGSDERVAYVEGQPMTVVPMDGIYAKQERVCNFFVDKEGYLRVGSVRFTTYQGSHIAQCVKCKAQITYVGEYDRFSMEDFAMSIMEHGHNHSAKWVTKTPIGRPVALSVALNDELVAKYNDVLFDQQVADAVAPTAASERMRRRNGLAPS